MSVITPYKKYFNSEKSNELSIVSSIAGFSKLFCSGMRPRSAERPKWERMAPKNPELA
jgi:hypothetical protein